MDQFGEFLQIVRRKWPLRSTLRYETIRLEFEACLEQGIPGEQIVAGTKEYLENHIPLDSSTYFAIAPHNFLREKSFLLYIPSRTDLKVVSDAS